MKASGFFTSRVNKWGLNLEKGQPLLCFLHLCRSRNSKLKESTNDAENTMITLGKRTTFQCMEMFVWKVPLEGKHFSNRPKLSVLWHWTFFIYIHILSYLWGMLKPQSSCLLCFLRIKLFCGQRHLRPLGTHTADLKKVYLLELPGKILTRQ